MKTVLPLLLILALAVACTGVPDEEVRSAEQNSNAKMTAIDSTAPSATVATIPSKVPAISVTAAPSRTTYPSATLPPSCGRVQPGKPGTQTKDSNHPVLIEGTAIFCNHGSLFDEEDMTKLIPKQEAMLDLDSGSATIETTADIGFGVFGRMRFYGIVSINNTRATFWSLNGLTKELPPQPTFDQCKEQANLFSNDNEPLYVCVITNEGHVARVRVEIYNPLEQVSSVEVSFMTWEEKVENP